VLVDTSIWVDHFRNVNQRLVATLESREVSIHPFVIGELACGRLSPRAEILELLAQLPQAPRATDEEVLEFIERERLYASGIGWIDAHLLASAALGRVPLWTADRPLERAVRRLGLVPTFPSSGR
jgi:predicted nucleic acid-binding protein